MSILKSINVGAQTLLTISDLLKRGWYLKNTSFGSTEERLKLFYKKDDCWMYVIQEADQLVLEGVWTYYTEQGYGKDRKKFRVTKYIRPRTLHDFCVLESHYELPTAEARVENLDHLFSEGFTDTVIEQTKEKVVF